VPRRRFPERHLDCAGKKANALHPLNVVSIAGRPHGNAAAHWLSFPAQSRCLSGTFFVALFTSSAHEKGVTAEDGITGSTIRRRSQCGLRNPHNQLLKEARGNSPNCWTDSHVLLSAWESACEPQPQNQPQRPPQEPSRGKTARGGRARFFRPRQMGHAVNVNFELKCGFPRCFRLETSETRTD